MLGHAASSLVQAMGGFDEPMPAVSLPHTWTAWQLPEATIARLFEAAATFHEARPWIYLRDEDLLRIEVTKGGIWTASVLGNAGHEFGLALYEDPDDLHLVLASQGTGEIMNAMRSAVISLTFDARSDLPKPMQREVARAGWRVAGPQAYPLLWVLNTPGGGVTSALMSELAGTLQAIARFATACDGILSDPRRETGAVDWHDAETGTVVHYSGRSEEAAPSLWHVPSSLAPGLPEGPNAHAHAALDPRDDFDELTDSEEIAVAQFAQCLGESGAPANGLLTDVENARLFVLAMTQFQAIPLAAVTEHDLRVFLYDWFPRKAMSARTPAMRMRGSLRRFFDFLAARNGITYPWAKPLLRDKGSFEERWDSFPGGFFWDEEVRNWQAGVYADLHARAMLPADGLADAGEWGEAMGPEEARLHALLQREWLIWRDDVIRAGTTDAHEVRAALVIRQREWELSERADLDGRSVSGVVLNERSRGGKKP